MSKKLIVVFFLSIFLISTNVIDASGGSTVVGLPYANMTQSELDSVISNGAVSLEPGSELSLLVGQLYPYLADIRNRYGNDSAFLVASFSDTNSPNNAAQAVPYILVNDSVITGNLPLTAGDIFFLTSKDSTGYLEPWNIWNLAGFTGSTSLIIPLSQECVEYLRRYAPELEVATDVKWVAVNLVYNSMVNLPISIVGTIDGLPNAPVISLPNAIFDYRIDPGWYPQHFHVVLVDINSIVPASVPATNDINT